MVKIDNKTCAKFEVDEDLSTYGQKVIFMQSVWETESFSLAVSDGLRAWRFEGSADFVKERAEVWDRPVEWVMEKLQFYLSVQQPNTDYKLKKSKGDDKKLSFGMENKDANVSLMVNLVITAVSNPEKVTCGLLELLLDGNYRLTTEYVTKCRSWELLKKESEACLEQSQRFAKEKNQFEQDIYKKFVDVLNSKKSKIKELTSKNKEFSLKIKELEEQLAKLTGKGQKGKEEEEEEEEKVESEATTDDDNNDSDHEVLGAALGPSVSTHSALDLDATQPFEEPELVTRAEEVPSTKTSSDYNAAALLLEGPSSSRTRPNRRRPT